MAVDRAFNYHLNVFYNIEANYLNGNLGTIISGSGTRTYTNSINYVNLASTISSSHNKFNSTLSRNGVALFVTGFMGSSIVAGEVIRFSISSEVTAEDRFSIKVSFIFYKRSLFITITDF